MTDLLDTVKPKAMTASDIRAALAAFSKEAIRAAWNGAVDGGSLQEMAERHGLIVATKYDPAVHGEWTEGEPGDGYFVFADWLKDAPEDGT